MEDREIRASLDRHWAASDANDFEEEHQIYREDAVLEYPQSAERIRGRRKIQASRAVQPNRARNARLKCEASTNPQEKARSPMVRWRCAGSHRSARTASRRWAQIHSAIDCGSPANARCGVRPTGSAHARRAR